jgi:hypothetical protein
MLVPQNSRISIFCIVCPRWLMMWINTHWATQIAINHSKIRRVVVAFTVRPNVGSLLLGSWLKSLHLLGARTWRSYSKLVRSGDKELLVRCVDPISARKTAPRTTEVITIKGWRLDNDAKAEIGLINFAFQSGWSLLRDGF